MTVRRIVTVREGHPVLRAVAKPVRRMDRDIRSLLDDMVETMREAPGVGLAAPQVGIGLRAIVVETPLEPENGDRPTRLYALANPEIVWRDPRHEEDQEACLSVPDLFGDVPRHVAVRVRGIDRAGRRVEIAASGFEARVFQHEIDHLDGVLFTDRVTGIDKLYSLQEADNGELRRVPYALDNVR